MQKQKHYFEIALTIALVFFIFIDKAEATEKLVNLELQNAKLSEVLQLFLKSVLNVEYMLAPDISKDGTPVNISLKNKTKQQANEVFKLLLDENNIITKDVGGMVYLTKQKKEKIIEESNSIQTTFNAIKTTETTTTEQTIEIPDIPLDLTKVDPQITLYKPHHLQATEIQKLLQFAGIEAQISNDLVMYKDTTTNPELIQALLTKFDGFNNDITIKATIFEFNKNHKDQSAIQAAINIIKSSANIALTVPTFGLNAPTLALTLPNFNAVIQNIASNDDFRVLSEPTIRVSHNKRSSINVGAEVPVLSQITTTNQGQPIQNVEYRSSGIILQVTPKIYTDVIELELITQISNFVPTTNGVNQTPTLIQRKLETSIKVKEGETVLMGGLTQTRSDKSRNTFFGFPVGTSTGNEQTDLLLVLHITKS